MTEPKPWIVHADSDKPHRCPNCWLVSGWVPWRTMTCCNCNEPGCPGGCGQRYASRPWLPYEWQGRVNPVLCTAQKVRNAFRTSVVHWELGRYWMAIRELLVPRTVDWWRTQRHLKKIREQQ